jgi:hypothetical protein
MTKQQQAQTAPVPEPEQPTVELLMRRFKLMDEIVDNVRKKNIEAGLDPKMGYFIHYDSEAGERRRYNFWIAKVNMVGLGSYQLPLLIIVLSYLNFIFLFSDGLRVEYVLCLLLLSMHQLLSSD